MDLVYDASPAGTLRVYKRVGDGAWLVEGDSNREGIYIYDEGGRRVRELRTADTVRKMTAQVARSVVTIGHPEQDVNPETVSTLSAGDVDGDFEIIDQGGFVRGRNRLALRTDAAIKLAEAGKIKGLSPGFMPIRDNTPGTHPRWGAYDRTLVDVAAVNHLALCGDSYELPPARGGDACGVYLDSNPALLTTDGPMKRKTRGPLSADAKAMIARIFPARDGKVNDAPSLEELAAVVTEALKDPESLSALVVHAIVNKPAEVAEIVAGEEPMDEMMPEMGAEMDSKIAAALAPIKATLDALTADKTARDAVHSATADATLREQARGLGVKDASTLAVDALVPAMAARLALSIDGLDVNAARTVVSRTAAHRATMSGPNLPTRDADVKVSAAQIGV